MVDGGVVALMVLAMIILFIAWMVCLNGWWTEYGELRMLQREIDWLKRDDQKPKEKPSDVHF